MQAKELKITDIRVADIDGLPKHMILVKVYTNDPDIVGYGEVRDASSATYAKMLKSRLVGENPLNVEKLFNRIKQKLLHSKLSVIAVLFFAFILLVSGGWMTRTAKAEEPATFVEENFAMCKGAEVRTDGEKSGIRFVASLGKALPNEEDYPNLKYYVMIVPNQYVTEGMEDYYNELTANYNYIAAMETTPFYEEDATIYGEEGYYIRGTLSNVKYENINVEWFGMAYITYDVTNEETQKITTEYLYAKIPETGANVRSLVYCASGYLNTKDYTNAPDTKEILTNFVAQGINKAVGVPESNKNDRTYLNEGIKAIETNATEQVNLLPEDTAAWTAGVPAGVKLHIMYGAEDKDYASVTENGVITGVLGDNNAETTKYVTMKALGVTYQKPVHVYTVTAEINENVAISTYDGDLDGKQFTNTAELGVTATVDGVAQTLTWNNSNENVAKVNGESVEAVFQGKYFASEVATLSYSFEFEGVEFTSNECTVTVSVPLLHEEKPLAYGDLMQNVFNDASTALVATTEAVNMTKLGEDFGTVTSFLGEGGKELLDDGKTNANVYGAKEAGEKEFTVVSANGYAYKVQATVVSYAIDSVAKLTYFFKSYETGATENSNTNVTYGTYVILSGNVEGFTRSDVVQNTSDSSKYTYYRGTFDGRGHKIKLTGSTYRQGFFGRYLGGNAVIKNVAIINIAKNSIAGGGLAYWMSATAVIDNCFIEVKLASGSTSASNINGVVYDANFGSITNTIVNVTASRTTNTSNLQTIGEIDTDNVKNCYSIGIKNQVTRSVGDSTDNVYFSADALLSAIVTDNKLPGGFNSYWTYTESGLSFGGNQVLEFTTTTE